MAAGRRMRAPYHEGTMQLDARPAEDHFTYEDHDRTPEGDGLRWELVGGAMVVTPSPALPHQRASRRLQRQLEDAAGPGYEVFAAPTDLDLPTVDRVVPDLVVVERGRTGAQLTLPVMLVVEIVSRGSTRHDRVTKRAVYADAGIPHYWLVDLLAGSIVCLRLGEGEYSVVADGPVVQTAEPLAVTIELGALLEP